MTFCTLIFLQSLSNFMAHDNIDVKFKHPSTIQISGPTQSGKTRFMQRVLVERMIDPFPTRIMWCYSEWQPVYDELKVVYSHIEFIKGFSDNLYDSIQQDERNLLIFDDQMAAARDTKSLANLFTMGSHHRNLTVVYIVQNLLDQGKSSRTVSLNTHYNVAFRNPRDGTQIRVFCQQLSP